MNTSDPALRGLTSDEAQKLLAEFGPNSLPVAKRVSLLARLLRQFQSALVYLLLAALAFDLVSWFYEGSHQLPAEALAIVAVLLLNATLGVLQEYRSEHALSELQKLTSPKVWVLRNGVFENLLATELVPGDVARLESGDRIPADGRALTPESLATDESLLTGESLPVEKALEDTLFSGSLVMRGRTLLEVTGTGPSSSMGRLAATLANIESGKTPLEQRIDQLGNQIARYVGGISILVLLGALIANGASHFGTAVLFAVAFGVAVVPEGLPAVMTLVLALGVQRMAKKNAVVRRLAAVEALGSVTVIATDKTGTLTLNQMKVGKLDAIDEAESLRALALANDADHDLPIGDPLELALVQFAHSRGADVVALRNAYPRVSSRPFDSRFKYMRATVAGPGDELRSYVKGAVELVLDRCLLSPEKRAAWLAKADAEARRGFKVLGLAKGPGDAESNLEFLGIVTLWDAPRPEAAYAVRAAREAGITVLMLTGDAAATAQAIAEQVGIPSERVLSGAELDALSELELQQALAEVRVFSRLLPEHKLRIVAALQADGQVVAMTGDGLNDAPALKRADVGVAMGKRGSEVAREVADVVLLDDNFATIVAAIEEGRGIDENIRSYIRFTFSNNIALMFLVLGSAVGSLFLGLRGPSGALLVPLTALQILWINFLGDGPPALALSLDRSRRLMLVPPRPPRSSLFDGASLRFILADGGLKAAVGLTLLACLPPMGASFAVTATTVFIYESTAKLLSVYPARRLGNAPLRNGWLHLAIGAGLLLGVACLVVSPRHALGLALATRELVFVAVAVVVTCLGGELIARLALRSSRTLVVASIPR